VAFIDSRVKAVLAAQAAIERQAEDVAVMDLRSLSTVTDFFVLCTAKSVRQLKALREHLERTLAQQGQRLWHVEGVGPGVPASSATGGEPHWMLMDYGDLVVHLFDAHARALYQLEHLWADAPRLPLVPNA
jgi:ribosome-associated protein